MHENTTDREARRAAVDAHTRKFRAQNASGLSAEGRRRVLYGFVELFGISPTIQSTMRAILEADEVPVCLSGVDRLFYAYSVAIDRLADSSTGDDE